MPTEKSKIKLLVVLVNYFNDDEIAGFIKSELFNQDYDDFEIIVVNNGSHQFELFETKLKLPRVTLLNPGKNLGYLHAFLHGIDHYKSEKGEYPELMILCNSDMHFQVKSVLRDLCSKYERTDFACIGPSIISTRQGNLQNPFMISRISKSKLIRIRFVDGRYFFYLLYQVASQVRSIWNKFTKFSRQTINAQTVYALHGSFVVFSKKFVIAAVDDLRDSPFLFGEEVYLAELARKHNFKMYYDPSFVVEHNEHATTGTFKKRSLILHEHNSLTQILNQFFE